MSASSSYNMVGWELTYKSVEKDISQKSDLIILLIHWVLILEKDFKCVGLGSEKTLTEADREGASDLLPDGWNQNDVYLIRYIKNDVLYVLTGSKSNDTFIVNFLHVQGEVASNIVINIESSVRELRGPISKLFVNHVELIERIKKELIDGPTDKINETERTRSESTLSQTSPSRHDILRIGNPMRPLPSRDIGVGYNDLHPLGGGGGMLFEIPGINRPALGQPNFPGHIPGARFDPFGEPDNDHFRAPTGNRGNGNSNYSGYPDFI